MRSGNPVLSESTFLDLGSGTVVSRDAGAMTINGTVNKTAFLLFLTVLTAAFAWSRAFTPAGEIAPGFSVYMWGGLIGGFVLALVTVFKKEWAPVTAPLYALVEGFFLGAVSALYSHMYEGIVIQAVMLTFATLFAMLFAYRSGWIRATEKFKLGVVAATGGIFLVYLATIVLGFFGVNIPMIHGNGIVGIGFSLFVIVIAALNLVLDFDFIQAGAEQGAPKYMEWYGAFGLMVTLVWLYIEFLRLLSKLQSRN
ncbi:Bax inhibitor-1/YccA family protein [Luteimonas terricola]|uniref:Membrane protein n=1 Tax=Luteimonas terricola TaxID=645597 RepID=A0ABQ2ECB6_9GAMM|nr:Bax inhibitor-1/YccA family protein [Luteimonas terricola]GGK01685.1 membrane protein [Luteimonas terricola]